METLIESELFGHVRGAFTGATQDRVGLFEYAQGGTVFLDEIADMPLATQSKLLRVMQNQELQRVGSPEVRKVDVRVIAATNRDMRLLVAENLFREDLYYRLSMVELKLPRLAERKEDLPLLERHFVEKFARRYGKSHRRHFPPGAGGAVPPRMAGQRARTGKRAGACLHDGGHGVHRRAGLAGLPPQPDGWRDGERAGSDATHRTGAPLHAACAGTSRRE